MSQNAIPDGCPRRQRLRERLDELDDRPALKLNAQKFKRAVRTLPKSATSWGNTHLLRCVAATRDGLELLQWVTERILNRQVPLLLRPLLFGGKLIGLQKQSKMAGDIEMLIKRRSYRLAMRRRCWRGGRRTSLSPSAMR